MSVISFVRAFLFVVFAPWLLIVVHRVTFDANSSVYQDMQGALSAMQNSILDVKLNDPLKSFEWLTEMIPVSRVEAWWMVSLFSVFQWVLVKALPFRPAMGSLTPMGNRSMYRMNAIRCYALTQALFFIGIQFGVFGASDVYELFPAIVSVCSYFFCAVAMLTMIKGMSFPSTSDSGSNGNVLVDFFWGTELNPRVGGVELKQVLNGRVLLIGWSLLLHCFLLQHRADNKGEIATAVFLNVFLQQVYILRFIVCEEVMVHSLDFIHDRFGFLQIWGGMNSLVTLCLSSTIYIMNHTREIGFSEAMVILTGGLLSIWWGMESDLQRLVFRQTWGTGEIWHRESVSVHTEYKTDDGKKHKSILLANGWSGFCRHPGYLMTIAATVFWSMPAGFDSFLPYLYSISLTFILIDRAIRNDYRCSRKYGQGWANYCRVVENSVIPKVW